MKKLFYLLQVVFITFVFFTPHAQAQMAYVGGGAYFGQQGCGGGFKVPREIAKIEKDRKRLKKEIDKLERKVRDAERELEKAERKYNKSKEAITTWLRDDEKTNVRAAVMSYLETGDAKMAQSTREVCDDDYKPKSGDPNTLPWKSFCDKEGNGFTVEAAAWGIGGDQTDAVFAQGSNTIKGNVVCNRKEYIKSTNHGRWKSHNNGGSATSRLSSNPITACSDAIDNFSTVKGEYDAAKGTFDTLNGDLEALLADDEGLEDDHDYEVERWQEEMADGKTSGGVCFTCTSGSYYQEGPSTFDKVVGLLGTAGMAAGMYFGTKHIVNQNQKMGWPTSPWMSYAMGYPFVMAGIYGAMGGGGGGAFGCSPGMYPGGMPGAFGYPGSIFGGGGLPGYPGMVGGYPVGFAGGIAVGGYPMGMPMGGFPMGGMPMGGYPAGIAIGGLPMGGMPMGGYPVGYPAGAIGIPMGGMPMGGFPMGGIAIGGAIGIAAGGYPMGMPMGGFPVGGYPMGGIAAGGFPMGGMPMGGYPMGGIAMGMPMGGMPMGGIAMGGSMMALQYQQQMLAMQQAQMNAWMQEQQRMQQDFMMRNQMVGRLSEELMRIQMQIQMISSGGYYGGGLGGGLGSGGLYPTGRVFDPNRDPNDPYSGPGRFRGYR